MYYPYFQCLQSIFCQVSCPPLESLERTWLAYFYNLIIYELISWNVVKKNVYISVNICHPGLDFIVWLPGPDGYPRVLDYSTFEFTTLPYSKNFTTRSSSRVVTISSFCPIIQIFGMGRHHSFLDNGRHVSNDVVAWSIRFRLHYSHRYIG